LVAVTVVLGPGTVAVTVEVGPGTVTVAVTVFVAVTVPRGALRILVVDAPLGANTLPTATRITVITVTTDASAVIPALA
jgi:hypothetical protein